MGGAIRMIAGNIYVSSFDRYYLRVPTIAPYSWVFGWQSVQNGQTLCKYIVHVYLIGEQSDYGNSSDRPGTEPRSLACEVMCRNILSPNTYVHPRQFMLSLTTLIVA